MSWLGFEPKPPVPASNKSAGGTPGRSLAFAEKLPARPSSPTREESAFDESAGFSVLAMRVCILAWSGLDMEPLFGSMDGFRPTS
jgi:hypothetical protein